MFNGKLIKKTKGTIYHKGELATLPLGVVYKVKKPAAPEPEDMEAEKELVRQIDAHRIKKGRRTSKQKRNMEIM